MAYTSRSQSIIERKSILELKEGIWKQELKAETLEDHSLLYCFP